MSYAENTVVSVEKSKAELDKLLMKAGATQRAMGADDEKGEAWVLFSLEKRQVRMRVPLPKITDRAIAIDHRRNPRTGEKLRDAYEQACRTRWRAMVLLTKAKLEAIAIGQTTVEREFLADIFLPDGRTVHQALSGGLAEMYSTGKLPPLLGTGEES